MQCDKVRCSARRKCTLLWQGAFLPTSSAAAPAFLAMALTWSSFTDTGTETLAIEKAALLTWGGY